MIREAVHGLWSKSKSLVSCKPNDNDNDDDDLLVGMEIEVAKVEFFDGNELLPLPTPVACRSKTRCLYEPDLLVVIGQRQFHHYSTSLAYTCKTIRDEIASAEFDYSNRQQKRRRRRRRRSRRGPRLQATIEFPDRDPNEWFLVAPFVDSTMEKNVELTEDTVDILLPWFVMLGAKSMIAQCDQVYAQMINTNRINNNNDDEETKSSYYDNNNDEDDSSSVEWGLKVMQCLSIMEKAKKLGMTCTLHAGVQTIQDYVELNPHVLGWPEFLEHTKKFLRLEPLCVGEFFLNNNCRIGRGRRT